MGEHRRRLERARRVHLRQHKAPAPARTLLAGLRLRSRYVAPGPARIDDVYPRWRAAGPAVAAVASVGRAGEPSWAHERRWSGAHGRPREPAFLAESGLKPTIRAHECIFKCFLAVCAGGGHLRRLSASSTGGATGSLRRPACTVRTPWDETLSTRPAHARPRLTRDAPATAAWPRVIDRATLLVLCSVPGYRSRPP